jgi:hypothetical protein
MKNIKWLTGSKYRVLKPPPGAPEELRGKTVQIEKVESDRFIFASGWKFQYNRARLHLRPI